MSIHRLFVIPNPNPKAKIRLFCFPFAGGGINTYHPWIDKMNCETEIVLVQPPGRGTRFTDSPHTSMDNLVDEIVQNAEFFITKPSIFFGHSLGSKIAYEVCCRLRKLNISLPIYLCVSGSGAPHLPHTRKAINDLPQAEFLAALHELNGTPLEVSENIELMTLLTPLLRADFKIAETYIADKVKMPIPIIVFNGNRDELVHTDEVKAWCELTSLSCSLIEIPGDHFFIHTDGSTVLSKISLLLESLGNNSSSHLIPF